MKNVFKVLFVIYVSLAITGCKDECKDLNRPWNMFDNCNSERPAPRTITSEWEKKNRKGCNLAVPGRFTVANKKNPYYKCTGIITSYPMLSDKLEWMYYFNRLRCGKDWDDRDEPFSTYFNESDLKRTGNLGD